MLRLEAPAERARARSEVIDLVYRHCKSAGLLLAMPRESSVALTDLSTARPPHVEPIELIEAIPIFATLTRQEKMLLAQATSAREFRRGEVIVRQGDILPALMMVRAGVVAMRRNGEESGPTRPRRLFRRNRTARPAWEKPMRSRR